MSALAVVTGGAGFLGNAISHELASVGWTVAVVDANEAALKEVDAQAVSGPGRLAPYHVDLTSEEDVTAFAEQSVAEHGPWQVLVNNAGINRDRTIAKLNLSDWSVVLDINLTAPFLMIRELARMLRRDSVAAWGRVINVSSLSAWNGNFGQANYAASKAGLEALTRVAARELASRGYTANAVVPGFIDSPMTSNVPDDVRAERLSQVPLGRAGTAWDVAATVRWLASESSGYVTGACVPVNGGLRM